MKLLVITLALLSSTAHAETAPQERDLFTRVTVRLMQAENDNEVTPRDSGVERVSFNAEDVAE